MEVERELSLWELAHRWHGVAQESCRPPYIVLDRLRWLCAAIDHCELVAIDYRVKEVAGRPVWEHLPVFLAEVRAGRFDCELLNSVFVLRENLLALCRKHGADAPSFWLMKGGQTAGNKSIKLDERQEDRIRCRAIAQLLWDHDPSLTIVGIAAHPWIQRYGNAAQYRGRDTVRNWIRDLNPKPDGAKGGRPTKRQK